MFSGVLLLFLVFKSTADTLTSGKHFVVACPWAKDLCEARVITAEDHVQVSIIKNYNNTLSSPEIIRVEPAKYHNWTLFANKNTCSFKLPSMMCPTWVVQSSGPIKILILTHSYPRSQSMDIVNLTPESKCHKSYFTVTTLGNPFLTVIAFNYSSTDIAIKFPNYPQTAYFNISCHAENNVNCHPNAMVKVNLLFYQAWYFSVYEDKSKENNHSLSHVVISAHNPINVISGNILGWSGFGRDHTRDTSTTSLKPSTTWGKMYVVPHFVNHDFEVVVTTNIFPMRVTSSEIAGEKLTNTRHHTINSIQHENIEFTHKANPLLVISDTPFGLYQIFHPIYRSEDRRGEGDNAILNLIPVEQWLHGNVYIHPKYDDFDYYTNMFLVTQGNGTNVKIKDEGEKSNFEPEWIHGKINNIVYSFTMRSKLSDISTIYMTFPLGKTMIYCLMSDRGEFQLAAYPYGFYHAEIYQKNCRKSKQVYLQDGVDNDCDGHIDEETQNGLDDDGDGLIDEDSVQEYSDGEWSEWSKACKQKCQGKSMAVRTRSCLRSQFGKICHGPSIQCNGTVCPRYCQAYVKIVTDCVCDSMCLTCRDSIFDCDGCKPGYMPTEHCKTPCPEGRTGIACTELNQHYSKNSYLSFFIMISIIPFIVVTLLVCSVVIFFVKKRRTSRTEDEEEQEEGETDEFTSNHNDHNNVKAA